VKRIKTPGQYQVGSRSNGNKGKRRLKATKVVEDTSSIDDTRFGEKEHPTSVEKRKKSSEPFSHTSLSSKEHCIMLCCTNNNNNKDLTTSHENPFLEQQSTFFFPLFPQSVPSSATTATSTTAKTAYRYYR
jgi:hypothetical protein